MPRAEEHHPRRFKIRGRGYFRGMGAGFVTGAADDDPAGIATYTQVSATLRFDLLWTSTLTLPLTAAVLELAGRLGLTRDRGLAAILREQFAAPVVYPTLGLFVLANTFNIGADLNAMAASTRLVAPWLPQLLGVTLFAVLMTFLEIRIPYARYAKLLRWLVLSLLAYVGVLAAVHVPWSSVAWHAFVPTFSADRAHLAGLIAVFGTTISPYVYFWQSAEEMEENDDTPDTVTPHHMRTLRLDVLGGTVAAHIGMFAIMTATAVTLGMHAKHIETASEAAQALRPIAGELATLLFAIGIVGTGLLAVPTLAGSNAYAAAEMFGWHEGLSRTLRQAPGFYGVIAMGMAVGVALNLVGIPPITALFASAIFNGIAAPPTLLLMLLAGRSAGLHRWRSGALSLVLVGLTTVIMTVLPIWYLLA
jgi:Mn2+/Fe2+ NRAMP family transporter